MQRARQSQGIRNAAAVAEGSRPQMVFRVVAISILVLLAAALMTGCASTHYRELRSEGEIPELAPMGIAHEELPVTDVGSTAELLSDRKVSLAMEEVGRGQEDALLVMLHGFLSDRTIWRYISAELGTNHRMLLVDLLGCGESDRPDPRELGPDGYSPTAQARYVLETLSGHFGRSTTPDSITVVGHSYGGAVVLRMLGDPLLRQEFPEIIARVDQAVLLAPLDFAIEKADPRYLKLLKLNKTKVSVASSVGLLRESIAGLMQESTVKPNSMPREYADRALEMLKERDRRRALQAMIKQAVPFDLKRKRPDWSRIEELVADYENVEAPTLILWGARDETLSSSMGYKLQAQLPDAWLRVFQRTMHSLPLEAPKASARYIHEFVRSEGRGWIRIAEIEPESSLTKPDAVRKAAFSDPVDQYEEAYLQQTVLAERASGAGIWE